MIWEEGTGNERKSYPERIWKIYIEREYKKVI